MASGTVPFCVQALMAHRADCPRVTDACRLCTATQRLTFAEAEYTASAALVRAAAVGLELFVIPDEGEPAFTDVTGDGSAVGLGVVVREDGLVDGTRLGEVAAGLVVAMLPLTVGAGVLEGAVGVGAGLDLIGVGAGDGLRGGGAAGSCSGSHP
jgi:hypothetical protein